MTRPARMTRVSGMAVARPAVVVVLAATVPTVFVALRAVPAAPVGVLPVVHAGRRPGHRVVDDAALLG
jgi:hypothetical protein